MASDTFLNNFYNENKKKKKKYTDYFLENFNRGSTKSLNFNKINEGIFEDKEPTALENVQKQNLNYATRLEAINADGKDTRNPLEKLLNLPEDQNFLFDIGEILDRPFNAIKGGIQASQEGEDVTEGLKSGITGEKTYYAGDILRNAGMSDEELFKNPLSGESVSAADLLGLGLDIFADPTSYIPVGGAVKAVNVARNTSKLAKATKAVDVATDALKAAQTVKKATDALDTASKAEKAYQAVKVANAFDALSDATRAKNAAQSAYDLAKNLPAPSMSLQDAAVYGLAGGAKRVAGVADKAITSGLSKLDDVNLNRMLKGGATAKQIKNFAPTLNLYRGAKNTVRRTANYGDSVSGGLINKIRETDDAVTAAQNKALNKLDNLDTQVDNYVKNLQKITDDNGEKIFKDKEQVKAAIEKVFSKRNKSETTNMYNFFSDAANSGRKTSKITGNYEELQKVADDINNAVINGKSLGSQITLTVSKNAENPAKGELILSGIKNKGKTKLKNVVDNPELQNYLKGIDVNTPAEVRNVERLNEANKNISDYEKAFNNDPEFKRLYDEYTKIPQEYADEIYKATGNKVNFSEITSKEGYFPKGLKEARPISNKNAFKKARFGDVDVDKANILYDEERMNVITNKGKKLNTLQTSGYSSQKQAKVGKKLHTAQTELIERENIAKAIDDIKDNKLSDKALNELRGTVSQKGNITLNKAINIKGKQVKNTALLKAKNDAIDQYMDYVSPEIMKKVSKTSDTRLAKSYLTQTTKYNNTLKKTYDLEKKIVKASNNGQDVSKMTEQLEKLYSDAAKYKRSLDVKKAQIEGSLSDKIINKMQKTVDETAKLTKGKNLLDERTTKLTAAYEEVEKVNNDMVSNLKNKINQLKIQFEKYDPSIPKNIVNDRKTTNEIKSLQGQLEFLNSQAGKDLFSTSVSDGIIDFVKRGDKVDRDLAAYANVFLDTYSNDPNVIRYLNKEGTIRPMAGAKVLNKDEMNDFINYLKNYQNLLPGNTKDSISEIGSLNNFINRVKGSEGIAIDRTVYETLMRNKGTEKTANVFVEGLNKINDIFKAFSTTSLGFHLRNTFGNYTNMFLSGIPMHSAVSEIANANRLLNGDYMWNLLAKGAKNATEANDLKLINQFLDAGFLDQADELRDLQSLVKRFGDSEKYKGKFMDLAGKIFGWNQKINSVVDSRTRMAVLSYANKHPEYVSKLGLRNAKEAVRFVAMDPANMTKFEKNVMRKVIPFYTFTKQNLLFQAKNILRNPSKYTELIRAINAAYNELDEDQYRDYQKSGMQIPVYTDENGNTLVLKTNLPAADLGEWFDSPTSFVQRAVSSSSPLFKTPIEIATGVDPFTGYESTKSGPDYLASILGLSNVTRAFENVPQVSEDNTGAENFARILSSVGSYNNTENIALNNAYEELEEYQNYINELEAQGITVPTLTELQDMGVDVEAIRDELAGDESILRQIRRRRERFQKSLGF